MTIIRKAACAIAMAGAVMMAGAQTTAENNTMYLIKGEQVVGKYAVDAVDYVSFKLPEGVREETLWLTVDDVDKNAVAYTVNTAASTTAYAHGIVSYYDANLLALDLEGDYFENISTDMQLYILKSCLRYVGYLGIGTDQYTMFDWSSDGLGGRFSVIPNTKYYLCAWELDPNTQDTLDTFVYTEFTTLAPGVSDAKLDVQFLRQNERGLAFSFDADSEILYIQTVYGFKNQMEAYAKAFGEDLLFGMFAQTYTLDELQGESELGGNIEAATWPVSDSGEYVMWVRGYDANGDMAEAKAVATAVGEESEGPEINILSRSKGGDKVMVNFEITPSNVEEAYVRLLEENDLENLLNGGYYYYEVASSSKATDIVSDINNFGEYTFRADGLSNEKWYSILIYALDKDGKRTIRRINFCTFEEAKWSDYPIQHRKPAAMKRIYAKNRRPTFDRVK